MGWFTVTILLQLIVPMAFMLLAKLIPLPAAAAGRTRIMTLVQDGQLGWVALGYSTTGAYDLYAYISKVGAKAEAWTHPVYTLMLVLICIASFLAAVGALFPHSTKATPPPGWRAWIRHYAAFVGTLITTVIAGAACTMVHLTLPPY